MIWLCRQCGKLVSPRVSAVAPEHPHKTEPLWQRMGAVIRYGGKVWRAAGFDRAGRLWGMPCNDSGADDSPGYHVELVPTEAWKKMGYKLPDGWVS
jgi:hypothetical protein